MVQTLPVSSNSEVLITFTREFGINPLVRDEIYITYDLFFAITKNHTLANSQRPAKSCYDNSHLFFKDLMSTEPIHNIKDSEKYETEYQCSKVH